MNKHTYDNGGNTFAIVVFVILMFGIIMTSLNYSDEAKSQTLKKDINSNTYISDNGCKYTKQCIFGKVYISGCTGTAILLDDIGRPIFCKKGEFK